MDATGLPRGVSRSLLQKGGQDQTDATGLPRGIRLYSFGGPTSTGRNRRYCGWQPGRSGVDTRSK